MAAPKSQLARGVLKRFKVFYRNLSGNLSREASPMGIHPNTNIGYADITSLEHNLPAALVPLHEHAKEILIFLEDQAGNPLTGEFDTSVLDGEYKDNLDAIFELAGQVITAGRDLSGMVQERAIQVLFRKIQEQARIGAHEVGDA